MALWPESDSSEHATRSRRREIESVLRVESVCVAVGQKADRGGFGHLFIDMFRELTPADDLEFRYGTNAPTLRIDGMTVAGT